VNREFTTNSTFIVKILPARGYYYGLALPLGYKSLVLRRFAWGVMKVLKLHLFFVAAIGKVAMMKWQDVKACPAIVCCAHFCLCCEIIPQSTGNFAIGTQIIAAGASVITVTDEGSIKLSRKGDEVVDCLYLILPDFSYPNLFPAL
jgi:hypothetical protein